MLYWSIVFFIVSFIAGLFGLNAFSTASINFAQLLFLISILEFIVTTTIHYIGVVYGGKNKSN